MAKLDLEKKLFLRKGKKVSPFIYKCLVNLVARPFLIPPMNVHVNYKVDVKKIKGPFIVVSNHTSRCDWMYVSKALYPQNVNYVVSYTEFCRGHMHFVFDLLHMIPKKNFVPDKHFVKELMQVLKDGGNVVIFPEGKSSISGTNQPIMNNTGRLFRYTKVPIYYTRISGGYMSNTQWNIANRPGKVVVEVGKLFDVEDFAKYAKDALVVDYALLIACGKPVVESVAVIGGGGSGHWVEAKEAGYDIYISGDAPHHVRREIVNAKYNYLDVPHEVEKIFVPTMKKILLGFDKDLEIVAVDHEKMPKVIC